MLLAACSCGHEIRLQVTVTNAEDGKPLSGVKGTFDDSSEAEEKKSDFDWCYPMSERWDMPGTLCCRIQYVKTMRDRPWYVKLQKDGFEPLIVDIRSYLTQQPLTDIDLPITIEMKPVPKKL
jgi:hypothetical protein